MGKTKTTQEHELLLGVKVNLEGFERLVGIQKKLNSGKEGMQNIVEFAATLNALAKTISELSGSGLSHDMQKIVAIINKAMSSLDKIDDVKMIEKSVKSNDYTTGRSVTRTVKVPDKASAAKFGAELAMVLANVKRELIDINNILARNLHLAQQKQVAEGLSVKHIKEEKKLKQAQTQDDAHVPTIGELTDKRNAELEAKNKRERENSDKLLLAKLRAEEIEKKKAAARQAKFEREFAALELKEKKEAEKAKLKVEKEAAKERLRVQKAELKARIDAEKLAAKKEKFEQARIAAEQASGVVSGIVADIISNKSTMSADDLAFKIRQANAELKLMPLAMRKVKADELVSDFAAAGINVRHINGKLEVVSTRVQQIGKHFGQIIKDMFSAEKIMSRISFVLTAKLSYDAMNILTRLPAQTLAAYTEFEQAMSKTFALVAGSSEVNKQGMQKDVLELSKTYGIAAKDVSAALYEIVSAQVPLSQSTKVLEQAIKLSLAGQSDLTTSTHALVQMVNAYELGFENIARVSDIAFQAVKYGQLTMEQYTNEMQKVISTASMFKISQEEISAAIATMTINGVGASQSFTALNQMLMVIANPTKQAKDLMNELGISLSIQDIQQKGLGFALQELTPLLNMTGKSGEELIATLFKTRTGFKAVASILQNMDEYGQNYIEMINSVGATEEALAERTNDVRFQMDKMKTAWQSFMISAVDGKNKSLLLVFFTSLTSLIKTLENNFTIVVSLLKIFVTQIGIFAMGAIAKFVTSINLSIFSLKNLKIAILGVGAASKAAWASMTVGLSVIIQGLIQAIHWLGVFASKMKANNLSKILKIDEATDSLRKTNGEIVKLDSNISRLQGVKKMIEMYDQLAKKQNKSNKEIEQMNNLFINVEKILTAAGIKISSTGKKIENLGKYIVDVDNKIQNLTNKRMLANLSVEGSELRKSLQDYYTGASSRGRAFEAYDRERLGEGIDYLLGTVSNTIVGSLSQAISKGDWATINKRAIDIEAEATAKRKKYLDEIQYQRKKGDDRDNKAIKYAESGVEATNAIIAYSLSLQSSYMGTQTTTKIPEFKEVYDGGGGKSSEKDFMSQIESLYTKAIGNKLTLTLEEWQKVEIQAADDILAEINKFEGTVLNKQASLDAIAQYKKMVETNNIVGLWGSAQEAINAQIEQAKALKNIGDIDGAGSALMSAKATYDSFIVAIKDSTDEQLIAGGVKAEDIPSFRIAMSTAMGKYLGYWFEQAKDILTDEQFISEAMQTYGFDQSVLDDFSVLESTIKDLEKSGQKDQADTLKKIKEMFLVGFRESLDNLFGITSQPEFIQDAIKVIKESISNNEIKDPVEMEAMIQKSVSAMRLNGMTVDDSNIAAMRKEVIPKSDGFNWQSMVGVKDYKDGNDALLDIGQQTIAQLQDVWSFYWEWEVRKLQEQHNKKLELMENEKSIMLANENMSAQQKEIIEKRFEERKRQMQEKMDKEIAAKKKKQAIFNASIDFARGLIGIWASELSKGILGVATAPVLTGLLSGIFAAQIAMINNQKFAGGGYTGSGIGSKDETGYKPAGIVHEGELVIDKKTLDKNFMPMMSLYEAMKSGKSFGDAVSGYMLGNSRARIIRPSNSGSFATGGLVGRNNTNTNTKITIDFKGIRTIDDIELNQRVEAGGLKRRKIG